MPTVLFCLAQPKRKMIFQAFLGSDFSQGRTLLSDPSGTVALWHDTLWTYDGFSLFVYAFSCFTASLSRFAVGKLLPVWAPCVPWSSLHTWLSSLSFWKGTGGCTLTSRSHELLNRILVHPEQNGCQTRSAAQEQWSLISLICLADLFLRLFPVRVGYLFIYFVIYLFTYLFISFTTQDMRWQQVISLSRLPLTL